mmetsp:Transcript_43583/g.80628  ORF Transcript_43583/g.80628 Transcript_43583/m.80628 type:complete len:229 (-) Transcript_43583:1000-1686(-)
MESTTTQMNSRPGPTFLLFSSSSSGSSERESGTEASLEPTSQLRVVAACAVRGRVFHGDRHVAAVYGRVFSGDRQVASVAFGSGGAAHASVVDVRAVPLQPLQPKRGYVGEDSLRQFFFFPRHWEFPSLQLDSVNLFHRLARKPRLQADSRGGQVQTRQISFSFLEGCHEPLLSGTQVVASRPKLICVVTTAPPIRLELQDHHLEWVKQELRARLVCGVKHLCLQPLQ